FENRRAASSHHSFRRGQENQRESSRGRADRGRVSGAAMSVTREQLASYLEDALSDVETAQVEQALRQSGPLRDQLLQLMRERDRGEHSVGAIWRRQRLTCQTRAQLGSYLLGVLEPELNDYIHFHLQIIGFSYC